MATKQHVRPVGAAAIAIITVEVRGLGSWGTDCSVEQVHRQASEAALGIIRKIDCGHRLTIIGKPEIKSIITERE